MKKLVVLFMAGLIGFSGRAQNPKPAEPQTKKEKRDARRERINKMIREEEEGELIFNKQSIFGIKLATDGYGLSYELDKFKSNRRSTVFQFQINEKKHPKEKKQSYINSNTLSFTSLIYGKVNNFYQVKLGMGEQRVIGGKGNKNGVAVSVLYTGGLSAGLLKPYYVDVEDNYGQRVRKQYPEISDSGYIEQGASGFTVGWSEVKFKPGVYAQAAMRFDYGRFHETVTAIEVGLNAEFYANKILQMAYSKEKRFFFNAYVTLLLGKRK